MYLSFLLGFLYVFVCEGGERYMHFRRASDGVYLGCGWMPCDAVPV
jgi:hypothetical protein